MADLDPKQQEDLIAAQKVLDDNKEALEAWKAAVVEARQAGLPAPPPPPSIAGAVSTIGGVLGNVVLGVGSTAADAISVVGNVAESAHENINQFFSKLRDRLGV